MGNVIADGMIWHQVCIYMVIRASYSARVQFRAGSKVSIVQVIYCAG